MRFINKYKYFQNLKIVPSLISNRVLRFKRPKWKKFQKQFQRRKSYFYDIFLQKLTYKQWNKSKSIYKKGLEFSRLLNIASDTKFPIKSYKKQKLYFFKDLILNFLLKKIFRVDLLLWKLQIFNSSYESRQFINNNHILVNNKPTYDSYVLKKGDVIKLKTSNLVDFSFLYKIKPKVNFLYSYLEIDYYTNCIVVIKDLENFSKEDCFLIFQNQSLNLKNFLYYVKFK